MAREKQNLEQSWNTVLCVNCRTPIRDPGPAAVSLPTTGTLLIYTFCSDHGNPYIYLGIWVTVCTVWLSIIACWSANIKSNYGLMPCHVLWPVDGDQRLQNLHYLRLYVTSLLALPASRALQYLLPFTFKGLPAVASYFLCIDLLRINNIFMS